jgi:hypothetical protein
VTVRERERERKKERGRERIMTFAMVEEVRRCGDKEAKQ